MITIGPWIGVDLDGTLATYFGGWMGTGVIGNPVPRMVTRVQQWIKEGKRVKIFTARAGDPKELPAIKQWLVMNGMPELEITDKKDYEMIELWDDRAIGVTPNTGVPLAETRLEPYLKEINELKKVSDAMQKKIKRLMSEIADQEVIINDL